MRISKYIEDNFMKDDLFNLIHDYIDENMLTDEDVDFIELLGFNFEDFIIEECDISVEDLWFANFNMEDLK